MFERLVIIGAGLIGSSIARTAKARGLARCVVVADAAADVRARVRALGLADEVPESAADAVRGADGVILCVPVGACGAVAEEIGPHLAPGVILSDVGSVKAAVVRAVQPHLKGDVHFVPAHPVAGTEHSGPDAGFDGLFDGRWCILTPLTHDQQKCEAVLRPGMRQELNFGADAAMVAKLTAFWRASGANVECMTPEHHDMVLAITSHVPHLIAYNIVGTAAHLEEVTSSEVIKFSAGGFRDFTRIAASDPTMWRDIFLNNREAVLEMLARFGEDLTALQKAIRWGDGDALFELFTRTRAIRRSIVETGQDADEPDFGRLKR